MNVAELRADTPGLEHRVHLNSAGASLMPTPVIAAIQGHIDLEARIGGYEAADAAEAGIAEAYGDVAELLGTHPDRIAFTEHATASFVAALSAIPFEEGDVLLTTRNDYVSNQIQYLALARRLGIEIVRAPDAQEGGADLDALRTLVEERRPRLVAATHVPTNSGLVQDVAAIGAICRENETLFLVDGCQSIGQMPVDVEAMGCDFFSATARKYLRGPRGAGLLYVSERVHEAGLEPLFPDMRGADWVADDEYRPHVTARLFESWEFAWALVLGTGAAAKYANDLGLVAIRDRTRGLATQLRTRMERLDGVRVLDRGAELGATVTVHVEGHRPHDLLARLRDRGINTGAQRRTDAVIDYDGKGVDGALRVSPHYFNDDSDLDVFEGALQELMKESRG